MREEETGNGAGGRGGDAPRVRFLGCKVNFADTHELAAKLAAAGGTAAVVGTCCVTVAAEKQSRKEVRRALRDSGDGAVVVTGCAARRDPSAFESLGAGVTVIDGPGGDGASAAAGGRRRGFLKVQDGCGGTCTYCIIPRVRGGPRSIPAPVLEQRARELVDGGCLELVVTGIDVGAYDWHGTRLPQLLVRLLKTPGLLRLRLSSIEVGAIDDRLLAVLAGDARVGRHLHVPLQSGDDAVLAAMGRGYDAATFLRVLSEVREALPGVNLTTDVITGFPGEDEAAFGHTLSVVEEAGFSKVHVFPYSPREGTAAAAAGDVAAAVKKERSRRLRQLSRRLGEEHRRRKLGAVSEVLLESEISPGVFAGYSSDYTRFHVAGAGDGPLVEVRGRCLEGEKVVGEVIGGEQPLPVL